MAACPPLVRILQLLVPLALLCACGGDERRALPPPAAGPEEEPPRVDRDSYLHWLQTLASDEFEGRAPASVGERKTVPFLIDEYKKLGLAPGNGDGYTQTVPVVEIRSEVVAPPTFVAGGQRLELKPFEQVTLSTRHTEPEVALEDVPVVFVGYGVRAPEQQWDDYAGADVRGKLVLVRINDPGFHDGDPELFRGRAMTYYGRWSYKFEEAARQGAAGVLILHDDAGASYGWEVVRNGAERPTLDLPRRGGEAPPRITGWLHGDAARRLFDAAGVDFDVALAASGRRGFQAMPLDATATLKLANQVRQTQSDNVLAAIPGRERPEEWVIYTAHWDHLGRNFQLADGIYNGLMDNATGTAALLAIAKAFMADGAPRRSVLFLSVTLEESGLLGSRWYTEHPVQPLTQTAAVINIDNMIAVGPTHDLIVIGHGASELDGILQAELARHGRRIRPELTPENGFYFRSDHFNFARKGVPALYAKSGFDHRRLGEEYGRGVLESYNRDHYHKVSDAWRDDLDVSGMLEDYHALYRVGRRIADGDAWPAWAPDSEFRAAREASGRP